MPCKLPEDLSCVTDDVFSYMCSLAMEKCSKKSEKKKASCGGAAMRKRLLIKNFVAQMLAQERQNCGAYQNPNHKEDYDGSTDERPTRMITYCRETIAVGDDTVGNCGEMEVEVDEEGDEEAEEEDEEEDADIEDEYEAASFPAPTTTFYDLNSHHQQQQLNQQRQQQEHQQHQLRQQDSMFSGFSMTCDSVYQTNCNAAGTPVAAVDAEEEDEEEENDEDEDENESDDEDGEEQEDEPIDNTKSSNSTVREDITNFASLHPSAAAVASTSAELFLHHHHHQRHYANMEMLPLRPTNSGAEMTNICVESSVDENLMYNCSSSLVCSTSALIMCGETVPSVYSTTNHFYDASASLLSCAMPHQTGTLYPPSSTSTAPMMLPSALDSIESTNGSSENPYVNGLGMSMRSPCSEWEEFHTVPPSREYIMDDSRCHLDSGGFYSLFPPSAYSAATPENFSAQQLLQHQQQPHQQQSQNLCHIMQDSLSTSSSSNTVTLPGSIFSVPKLVLQSTAKSDEVLNTVDANNCSRPCDNEDRVPSTQCSEVATTSYAPIQTLPDNFLDESGAAVQDDAELDEERSTSPKCNKIDSLPLCFWNQENCTDNNNNNDGKTKLSDKECGDSYSGNESATTAAAMNDNEYISNGMEENSDEHNKIDGLQCLPTASNSLRSTSNALRHLTTVLPSMIKLGSCRSEFNQKSSYRRCITDLDTNTVVEEEYSSSGLTCYNSLSSSLQHTITTTTAIGPLPRKRPSSPYFDTFEPEQSTRSGNNGSAATGLCGMMMLTTSPKRVKL